MGQIEIVPTALLNAAEGLQKYVKPDMDAVATRAATAYLTDPPGWGVFLSVFEAQLNMVGDYHAKNLKAAGEAVDAIAQGLRKTVDNYNLAEQANVSMLLGSPSVDGQNLLQGWADSGFARTFYTAPDTWLGGVGEGIAVATQLAFVGLSFATADLVPSYLAAPIAATLMVCNGFSIRAAAEAMTQLVSDLDGAIEKFTKQAGNATTGWKDRSVVAYQDVIADLTHELNQAKQVLDAMAKMLTFVLGAMTTYWLAFLAFTGTFFLLILNATLASIGPQAAFMEPVIQSLGAAAAVGWLGASGTVVGLVTAAAGILTQVVQQFVGVQTLDKQGDSTPDIRQIKIEWHS